MYHKNLVVTFSPPKRELRPRSLTYLGKVAGSSASSHPLIPRWLPQFLYSSIKPSLKGLLCFAVVSPSCQGFEPAPQYMTSRLGAAVVSI